MTFFENTWFLAFTLMSFHPGGFKLHHVDFRKRTSRLLGRF
jgi:hypothetical protein